MEVEGKRKGLPTFLCTFLWCQKVDGPFEPESVPDPVVWLGCEAILIKPVRPLAQERQPGRRRDPACSPRGPGRGPATASRPPDRTRGRPHRVGCGESHECGSTSQRKPRSPGRRARRGTPGGSESRTCDDCRSYPRGDRPPKGTPCARPAEHSDRPPPHPRPRTPRDSAVPCLGAPHRLAMPWPGRTSTRPAS